MIAVGMLIEWVETEYMERILWINPSYTECYVIRLNSPFEEQVFFPHLRQVEAISSALNEDAAIVRQIDPYVRFNVSSLSPSTVKQEENNKAWELIKDLVVDEPDIYNEKLRWAAICDHMKLSGATAKTYYKYLRRYWAGGKLISAVSQAHFRKGGKGKKKSHNGNKLGRPSRLSKGINVPAGVNITEDIERIFGLSVKQFYLPKKRKSLPKSYDEMIAKYFSVGDLKDKEGNKIPLLPPKEELPTFASFKAWYYRTYNARERSINNEGMRKHNLKRRAVLNSAIDEHFGPGSIYQIDATIGDVYLVSRFDRTRLIGRPVIYVVIDAFSRLIVGMYVGLEGPSWTGARMALANAFENKVDYCKQYGISINEEQWPVHHLPKAIIADNAELKSKASDNVVGGLHTPLLNAAPYRADWKPYVEQMFNLLNVKAIKWLPGAVHKRQRERGEKDYRLDGKMTLDEFTKCIIETVLEHNLEKYMDYYEMDKDMIAAHVSPYPTDLWNWGIPHRGGGLRTFPSDFVRFHLMPKDEATVTREGIRYEDMYYSCETAIREAWFEQAASTGKWKIQISYDFRSTDVIYIQAKNRQGFERCELTGRSARYKGTTLEEARDYNEIAKINRELSGTRTQQSKTEYSAKRNAIIDEATQKTNAELNRSDKSNTARTKEIRNNRREEKEVNRETEKFDIGKKLSSQDISKVIELPRKEEDTNDILRPKTNKRDTFLNVLEDLDE
ncbi:Mu transposase C-terminal domain-containing protein [Paenibacillus sp. FSL H7-0357]|uniref:Mu transposase C-terminal domain-containing protein n=1 Tax=Paenibacillus sp. FSL H7-0357 TaxID=1536774 RepID=UPI0006903F85|nr:Mu transposase C-terminal domain-containing protein [Paenibacillus sp. FSL H7-0357]